MRQRKCKVLKQPTALITGARYKRDEDRLLAIITNPTKYDDDTAWRALGRLRKLQADNAGRWKKADR